MESIQLDRQEEGIMEDIEEGACYICGHLRYNEKNIIYLIIACILAILLGLSVYYNVVLILYENAFMDLNTKVSDLIVKFNDNIKRREEEFDAIYKRIIDIESKRYM